MFKKINWESLMLKIEVAIRRYIEYDMERAGILSISIMLVLLVTISFFL